MVPFTDLVTSSHLGTGPALNMEEFLALSEGSAQEHEPICHM